MFRFRQLFERAQGLFGEGEVGRALGAYAVERFERAGVSVAARWRLEYPGQADRKTAEGLTLIVLRRTGKSWEIVQDASM